MLEKPDRMVGIFWPAKMVLTVFSACLITRNYLHQGFCRKFHSVCGGFVSDGFTSGVFAIPLPIVKPAFLIR